MRRYAVAAIFALNAGSAFAQNYTIVQWGMNRSADPSPVAINVAGNWRQIGTMSSGGVFSVSLPPDVLRTGNFPQAFKTMDSYWNDKGALNARPLQYGGRLVVGKIADVFDNNYYNGTHGYTGGSVSGYFTGDWMYRDALAIFDSPNGRGAATFASRASLAAGGPFPNASNGVLASFFAVNDVTATTSGFSNRVAMWAGYFEAMRMVNTGYTVGIEIDIGDQGGGDASKLSPYMTFAGYGYEEKMSTAMEIRCGGSKVGFPAGYSSCSGAVGIGYNGATFKTGISFFSGTLEPNGSGYKDAIMFSSKDRLVWHKSGSEETLRITSSATVSGNTADIELSDGKLALSVNDSVVEDLFYNGEVAFRGPDVLFNQVRGYNNTVLAVYGQGTGSVCLGTSLTCRWLVSSSSGDFLPNADNTYAIGSASARASAIYATTAVIGGASINADASFAYLTAPASKGLSFGIGGVADVIRISSGGDVYPLSPVTRRLGLSNFAWLSVATKDLVMTKQTSAGTAPGAGVGRIELVAGTTGGTCKLQAYAGTSTTPSVILDNIGSGC